MKYIASFDIGTTNTKGVLISKDGCFHFQTSISQDTIFIESDFIEQEPEMWWKSIIMIANGWWENSINPGDIEMIALSGQMQDCIPIDINGKPSRNAILYSDSRAKDEAEEIINKYSEHEIRNKTGNHFDSQMTFPKILWILKNEQENYNKTDCILISSKDYVIRQLTGNNVTDPTSATTSGMMDIYKRKWLFHWLEEFKIKENILPKLLNSDELAGVVSGSASCSTGFLEKTPVFCGIGDAGASTVGAGVIREDKAYVYIGTTGWVAVATKDVKEQGSGVFNLAHLPKDYFISIAPIMNAGNVHKWIVSIMGDDYLNNQEAAFMQVEQMVENTTCDSKGLIFLPYLNGERCPIQDTKATGCFIGLKESTTKGQMCRAVLEGVAMSIKQVVQLLLKDNKIDHLMFIGGGSKSKAWCQIFADILGVNIFVMNQAEYLPALGAACPAFIMLKWAEDYDDYVNKYILTQGGSWIKCNLERKIIYDDLYEKYLMIYPALKPIFDFK